MTDIVDYLKSLRGNLGIRDGEEYSAWIKVSRIVEAADEIERLRLAITNAAECIDADDVIGAHELLSSAILSRKVKKRKWKWKCPIDYPSCEENCGSYGCGN